MQHQEKIAGKTMTSKSGTTQMPPSEFSGKRILHLSRNCGFDRTSISRSLRQSLPAVKSSVDRWISHSWRASQCRTKLSHRVLTGV